MEAARTKLVEEGNTIYEIDLDCLRRKERKREQEERGQKSKSSPGGSLTPQSGKRREPGRLGNRDQDFS